MDSSTSEKFKQRSRQEFDRQAGDYDRTGFGRHARRLHGDVMAAVEVIEFADVLDVGCGTGATLLAISTSYPSARVCGVDLSPRMIEVAGGRLGARAQITVADAEQLPFADKSFDLVTCVDSLHHYPEPSLALSEMWRVLRPCGGLVVGEWNARAPFRQLMNWLLPHMPSGDVRIYSAPELVELVEGAGFEVERCAPAGVRGQLLVARAVTQTSRSAPPAQRHR